MATTNLELDEISESQLSKYQTHNNALADLDSIIAGVLVKNFASDADYTLSTATNPEEWQYAVIDMTDSGVVLTTARNVIVPTNKKLYVFQNDTAQTLTIKTSAGTGIAVEAGYVSFVYCDGTNVDEAFNYSDSAKLEAPTLNDPVVTGFIHRSVSAGITASVTQTQGQQPLTADINEVSTVGNASDVVTLPTAVAGMSIRIINNGANTLQIFPASSDNLGAGVDTSTTLAAGSNVTFEAYDATNWETI